MQVLNQDSKHTQVSCLLIRKANTSKNSHSLTTSYSIHFLYFHQLLCALRSLQKEPNFLEVHGAAEQLGP